MVTCDYSGKEIPKGTGKMYVLKDGKVVYFYSNKEFKQYKMKRRPAKQGWTAQARKVKEMRMAAMEHKEQESPESVAKKKATKAKQPLTKHAIKQKKKDEKAAALKAKAEKAAEADKAAKKAAKEAEKEAKKKKTAKPSDSEKPKTEAAASTSEKKD